MVCPAPEAGVGMAVGLAEQFDCISRTLGRDGFLAVAGYAVSSGMLTSLLVISVALIGYNFIFLNRIDLGFGVGRAAKLGVVLALLSGWTMFQTLFYDVMIAGPAALADLLLGPFGKTTEATHETVQQSYDALRLGTLMSPEAFRAEVASAVGSQVNFQLPSAMPDAANTLLVSTIGAEGALKIAVGFLLAIAPFPIAALLFSYSQGFFWGWLRALFAGFLAITGTLFLNSLHISTLAASIARVYDQTLTTNTAIDDIQAIPAISSIFSLTALAMLVGVLKISGNMIAITKSVADARMPLWRRGGNMEGDGETRPVSKSALQVGQTPSTGSENGRMTALVDSLNSTVMRESAVTSASAGKATNLDVNSTPGITPRFSMTARSRRVLGRQHISLKQRDRRR